MNHFEATSKFTFYTKNGGFQLSNKPVSLDLLTVFVNDHKNHCQLNSYAFKLLSSTRCYQTARGNLYLTTLQDEASNFKLPSSS